MMTKGIDNPADAPAPLVCYRPDLQGTCGNRAGEDDVRVVDGQDYADGAAVGGFRTKIVVTGRFISEPELSAFDRKPRHNITAFTRDSKEFGGAKRGFVEVYR